MASGHRRGKGNFTETSLNRILANSKVKARLARPFKVDKSYDSPLLGGSSWDGSIVYIDRHLPKSIKINRKPVSPLPFLIEHERVENAIMNAMGYKYDPAHELATLAEHKKVKAAGIDLKAYETALKPYIKNDSTEKLTRVPKDLNLHPYLDEEDSETRAILAHFKSLGIKTKRAA